MFLQRRHYRQRRLRDASRLLPVLGAFLFLLPILWAPSLSEARDTAPDGIYLFVAWAGLIIVARLLAQGLTPDPGEKDEDDT